MVRNQRPKKVLCVGSMYGYIPYMLAKACQDNGYGSVDFVDANRDMKSNKNKKNHFYGQGFWQRKNLEKHFDYFLDKKYIKIHVTKTKNFANKYPKKKYDLIYLDGDHSYKGAKLDLKLFWPKLNKDGFMCFHDIHLVFPDIMGVEYSYKKFWEELMKKQTYQYKFELSNHYSGLGFLQKL
jgi:predicted O-methyltransferase YrrM